MRTAIAARGVGEMQQTRDCHVTEEGGKAAAVQQQPVRRRIGKRRARCSMPIDAVRLVGEMQQTRDYHVTAGRFISSAQRCSHIILTSTKEEAKWLVQSKPQGSPPEERLHESSWPPRLLASQPPPPEESRSRTDTDLVPLPFEKSDVTKSQLSF